MAENHKVVELGNRDSNCSASPSSTSVYYSTRIEDLLQSQTNYETTLDFEIAASKDHWSELQQPLSVAEDCSGGENGQAHLTNNEIVQSLQRQFPQTDGFFNYVVDYLVLGKKIAKGAQAEIFEATYKGVAPKLVLKVFKEGSSVLDLQKQWPLEMLRRHCEVGYHSSFGCSPVLCGTVVMNKRFAFMMLQCAGDLRKLIDKRMERNGNRFCAPFSDEELGWNMWSIANGMNGLHEDNIVHRDLKASNVLIYSLEKYGLEDLGSLPPDSYQCLVADYECSVGVVGTAFWRAPEILQGLKAHNITEDLFTKEADVYAFAMTCYEMITGKLPFEGVRTNDYDVVLRGDRPTLPEGTKPWIKTLLSKCWHSNPKRRPTFEEILKCIRGSPGFFTPGQKCEE